ncbi:MAG: hypothetical protein IPP96_08925 [Chitinophagaceae bacterium]|nr:hypothetical protein [Chitinophagaceae bacterium]
MKYSLKITKYLAIFAGALILFSACKKVKVPEPMGDAGRTLVKIIDGGTPASINKKPVDFVPTPSKILAVELRRDVPNNAELQKTMIVTVKDDLAAVTAANPAYIQLPTAWYTIAYGSDGVKTGGQGGTFTFTFKPGDFAKEIYIVIPDATLLNPSSLYGLGFTIMTADAGGIVSAQKSVVVEIGAKNNWDGVYEMSGTFVDVSNAAFTYYGDQQYSLITVGATKCVVRNDDLNGGVVGYLFSNAGTGTYYGTYGLVISFNPATNAIADLYNYYGDPTMPSSGGQSTSAGSGPPLYSASNTRRAVLDPSGVNAVQGNKDILIKHWLVQPNTVTTPPNIRSSFNETWKYLGPR